MARKESTLPNMVLSLAAILFVFAVILALTHAFTKDIILRNHAAKVTASVRKVLPAFDNDPVAEKYHVASARGELTFYPGRTGGKLSGIAVETLTEKGYSGLIRMIVGFYPDGRIYRIEILEHMETPGLGNKIENGVSSFPEQFREKNPASFRLKTRKDGGDIDAITAATISSRAYADALQFAYDTLMAQKKD